MADSARANSTAAPTEAWRRRVLDVGAAALAALGVLWLLVIGLQPFLTGSLPFAAAIHASIAGFVIAAVWRSGPYRVRAGLLLVALLVIEFATLLRAGFVVGAYLSGLTAIVGAGLLLGVRWAVDRLRYPRGTRLAMGNALVANLFHKLLQRSGQVWFRATATRLLTDDGRVVGAIVAYQGRELRVRVRRGVVLAGGGFSASPDWRAKYLPSPTPQYTRAGEGSTGDTLALAHSVGGALGKFFDGKEPIKDSFIVPPM